LLITNKYIVFSILHLLFDPERISTHMRNSAQLHNPASVASLDGIELELAKLYRNLQTLEAEASGSERSARITLGNAIEDLLSWMGDERGLSGKAIHRHHP
jgi:hypothetical protein